VRPFLLHHYLARSAARAPERPALVAPNGSLDYRQLDELSNALANALIAQGISKGDRIGIDLEKCAEAVVAIYGILKAGGTYVPLDPRAPAQRKAMIMSDCAMRGLITSREKLQGLQPALAGRPPCVVLIDAAAPAGMLSWSDVASASRAIPTDPGTIELDHYRGRTFYPAAVQAAERAVREAAGLSGVDDLKLLDVDRARVRFRATDGRELAAVVEEVPGPTVPASCGDEPVSQKRLAATAA